MQSRSHDDADAEPAGGAALGARAGGSVVAGDAPLETGACSPDAAGAAGGAAPSPRHPRRSPPHARESQRALTRSSLAWEPRGLKSVGGPALDRSSASAQGSLVRAAAVLPLALALGCGSNHRVSEWGEAGAPRLSMFVGAPDLDGHLDEMSGAPDLRGFEVDAELHGDAGGTHYVARSFKGPRELGREQRAIRVASPSGVILALGPIDPRATVRTEPDDLVRALVPASDGSGSFRSMTDLTGDGTLDLAVRAESGELAIYSLGPRGATRVEVQMAATPTEGVDVDGDGKLDLRGSVPIEDGDPIAPDLVDVGTFDGRAFSDRTDASKAFHRDRAEALAVDAPATVGTTIAVRRAIERAWHAILGGGDKKEALEALERVRPDASLRPWFLRHKDRVGAL